MKNTTHITPSLFGASPLALRRHARAFLLATATLLLLLSAPSIAFSGSATWQTNPVSRDWNTAANWMPMTVPTDTATFDFSNTTIISISAFTQVGGITFNPGASAFATRIGAEHVLFIFGIGVTNNSGITQNFVTVPEDDGAGGDAGVIAFAGSATAGSLTAFTNNGATVSGRRPFGGNTSFGDTSTAGNGTFTNNGGVGRGAFGGAP